MLFVSKIKDFRMIRRPSDRIMDEQRRPIVLRGERVEFTNWRFVTEDPDLIEWLLNHQEYGITFTSDKRNDKAIPQPKKQVFLDTDDEVTAMARAEDNLPAELQRPEKKFERITAINKKLDAIQRKKAASMARGSMSTAWGVEVPDITDAREVSKAKPEVELSVRQELTEDRVTAMINSAVDSAVNRVVELMKGPATTEKSTKTFHCKECGEEFKSGIAVGKHKVVAHPGKQEVTPEVK